MRWIYESLISSGNDFAFNVKFEDIQAKWPKGASKFPFIEVNKGFFMA